MLAAILLLQVAPPPADLLPVAPDVPCAVASDQPASTFRVQLTPEQDNRAKRVYQRSIVITAHDHCFHPADFKDSDRVGITARTIKVTVDGHYRLGAKRYSIESEVAGWEERRKKALALLDHEIESSGGRLMHIRRVDDIVQAKRGGKLGIVLSFEGGRPLAGKIENLKMFYELGLRELQLYWAVPSALKNSDGTLSAFGAAVIRETNRLGIVTDFSHMPDAAFRQAVEITKHPVLISHCAVAKVSGVPARGTDQLDDDTIRAVARTGGVICLHFYEGYIRPSRGPHATVEDLVDHMEYIKRIAGIDHIGLGLDFFPEKGWRWIEGAERMPLLSNVAREMVRRGFTDQEIEKVLGRNLMRLYERVWK